MENNRKVKPYHILLTIPLILIIVYVIILMNIPQFDMAIITKPRDFIAPLNIIIFIILPVLSLLFLGILIFSKGKSKRMKKMENYLLILSIIYIIFEVIVLSFPYKLIFRRRGSLSACKTNMKAIAWALDMYSGRNGFYPDPYINRHPASEEGILVKQGYIKSTINDPLAHWDYIYIYNSDRHIYEILCPNPEMYRYSKHDYLKRLKFESEKGIVTDPEGK